MPLPLNRKKDDRLPPATLGSTGLDQPTGPALPVPVRDPALQPAPVTKVTPGAAPPPQDAAKPDQGTVAPGEETPQIAPQGPVAVTPMDPEQEERVATIEADQQIRQELQEGATFQFRNPKISRGGETGRMAVIRGRSRNPYLPVDEGQAIFDVTEVARGALDAHITADQIALYRSGTERVTGPDRRKAHITTGTRQEERNRARVLRRVDAELESGIRKIDEALLADSDMSADKWATLVDQSFTNLTHGVGLAAASWMMPEHLKERWLNVEGEIDKANKPIYKQFLAGEGITDPAEQDRLISTISDGGEGQAMYEDFQATEGSNAFYRVPTGKMDKGGKPVYEIKQQTRSAASITARAEARALMAAENKLADLAATFDAENKAEQTVMERDGLDKAAIRIAHFLQTEPDISAELAPETKGKPILIQRGANELTAIGTRAYRLLKDNEGMTVEKAIESAVTSGLEDGTIKSRNTPRQVYIALRSQVRETIKSMNDTEVGAARETGRRNRIAALQRVNTELGEMYEAPESSATDQMNMAAGLESAADIKDAAKKILLDRFSGLPDMEQQYLESGIDAAINDPALAFRQFKPVLDVFQRISGDLLAGRQGFVRTEKLAAKAAERKQQQISAEQGARAEANAKYGLVTEWDYSGGTPKEVTFPTRDEAIEWLSTPTEGRKDVLAKQAATRKRDVTSTAIVEDLKAGLDMGYGWTAKPLQNSIGTLISEKRDQLEEWGTSRSHEDDAQRTREEIADLEMQRSFIPGRSRNFDQMDPLDVIGFLAEMENTLTEMDVELNPADRKEALGLLAKRRDVEQKKVDEREKRLKLLAEKHNEIQDKIFSAPEAVGAPASQSIEDAEAYYRAQKPFEADLSDEEQEQLKSVETILKKLKRLPAGEA